MSISSKELTKVIHTCGCAIANLNPETDDYLDNIELLENAIVERLESLVAKEIEKAAQENMVALAKKIDGIFEDLMIGHDFDYASRAIKELLIEET